MIIELVQNQLNKEIDLRFLESSEGENFFFKRLIWVPVKECFSLYEKKLGKPYTGFFVSFDPEFHEISYYKNNKEIYSINKDKKLSFLGKNESSHYYFLPLCDDFIDLDSLSLDSNGRNYRVYLTSHGIMEFPEEINIKNGIIENEFFYVSEKNFQIKIKKYI